MLDKWSPTSKLSDIKFSHYPDGRYFFHLYENPPVPHNMMVISIKPGFFYIFKSFPLFIMIEFWVLDNMLTLPI